MKKIMLVLGLAFLPSIAGAISTSTANGPYIYNPSKVVIMSSATANIVVIGSAFTAVEPASIRLAGSDYILLQSTYAGGAFCCSFETTASSTSVTTLTKGCVAAEQERGGKFYAIEFLRWFQNLRVYCASLDSATPAQVLRVFQSR